MAPVGTVQSDYRIDAASISGLCQITYSYSLIKLSHKNNLVRFRGEK